jgi:cell division septum initiation protein DivIVA
MSTSHDSHEAEAPQAAARLLELAARNADELLDEAKAEAASITAAAHAEADVIRAEARKDIERESAELERHRESVLSALAQQQTDLEAEVFRLQQLEQDYRGRMRTHLTQVLEQLEPDVD